MVVSRDGQIAEKRNIGKGYFLMHAPKKKNQKKNNIIHGLYMHVLVLIILK